MAGHDDAVSRVSRQASDAPSAVERVIQSRTGNP